MKKPLVTVCIPVYNHEKYVAESIQSVIDQDYENIELIIINDGSKDNSDNIINQYLDKCKDRFVRFEYRDRENKGLSATLNESLEWAKGKYYSPIASDDVLLKNKISLLTNKLEELDESYAIAFGDASFVDDNTNTIYLDKKTGLSVSKEKGLNSFLEYYTLNRDFNYKDKNEFGTYKSIIEGNYLPAMSFVARLDKVLKVEGWTVNNRLEDIEMWLKLSRNYKFAYIDAYVAKYRWHLSNSMKTLYDELQYDLLLIFKKEFNYKNNHENKYFKDEYYYNFLINIILFSKSTFRYRLKLLLTNNVITIIYYILKKINKKLRG